MDSTDFSNIGMVIETVPVDTDSSDQKEEEAHEKINEYTMELEKMDSNQTVPQLKIKRKR